MAALAEVDGQGHADRPASIDDYIGHVSDTPGIQMDMLGLEEPIKAVRAVQATEPRTTEAACFTLGKEAQMGIDPNGPRANATRPSESAAAILAEHAGGQPIIGGIRFGDRPGFVPPGLEPRA